MSGLDTTTTPTAPQPQRATRPLYWSVRRELWEHRSLYLGPLLVALVILFGFLLSSVGLPRRMRNAAALDALGQRAAVAMPYNMIAGLVMIAAGVAGFFYCLDALHGERRDRSILFWKSLPVSDRTTVLAKASMPLVVMPLFVLITVVLAHTVMLWFSTVVLVVTGSPLRPLWTHAHLIQTAIAFAYALVAISLWIAPIYSWLLLLSAWTKRATFLWAVLPPVTIIAFERMTARSSYAGKLLGYRVVGWYGRAFAEERGSNALNPLSTVTPGRFLATPGLWIGLILAALFLAAAVRLRRNREPI